MRHQKPLGKERPRRIDMYTLLYLKWITNKALLYSTWNSTQYYAAAWMGGEFGGEWIHVYIWLTPFTVHLTLSKQLIGYTPVQNKNLKKRKKKSPGPGGFTSKSIKHLIKN